MQRKILVDHLVASNAVSELLRQKGYLVEEVDGQKALSITRSEKYAAIISDIVSDGLHILEKVKAIACPVPVILMSKEHILTRNEAIQLGAYELIEQSDVALEQLNKITRVLNRANLLESGLAVPRNSSRPINIQT